MSIPHCVKCGKPADTRFPNWETLYYLAPHCTKHRDAVRRECSKGLSMWPTDFYGGWSWDGKLWNYSKPRTTTNETHDENWDDQDNPD